MFPAFPSRPRRRVLVTGMGIISPIGTNISQCWEAVCKGTSGTKALSTVPFFTPEAVLKDRNLSEDTKKAFCNRLLEQMPCKVAAPVLADGANGVRFAPTAYLPRSCQFSAAAVKEALMDAGLLSAARPVTKGEPPRLEGVDMDRMGVYIGAGIPSTSDIGDVSYALFNSPESPKAVSYAKVHPFFIPKMLGSTPASAISLEYRITGPTSSIVAACATGSYCIGEAGEWIQNGRADVVICGATESCINPIGVAGFGRMKALNSSVESLKHPETASRPFDATRSGFVMGEGAGILILEAEEHAKARGVAGRAYGELRGFGLCSDAYHVAAPDPTGRGAARSISLALENSVGVPANAVQYVNAHATGTIGDPIELEAIYRVLREPYSSASTPPLWVSSVKGAIGHLLGAAGSAEAIFALLALRHQHAPPNINLSNPCWDLEEQKKKNVRLVSLKCQTEGDYQLEVDKDAPVLGGQPLHHCDAVMSTSFGFGGLDACLLFSRY